MPRQKLSLAHVKDNVLGRNFAMIRDWANSLQRDVEVQALDSEDVLYISVKVNSTPKQLLITKKDGSNEVLIGTVDIMEE
jgi:hypothetical protein